MHNVLYIMSMISIYQSEIVYNQTTRCANKQDFVFLFSMSRYEIGL